MALDEIVTGYKLILLWQSILNTLFSFFLWNRRSCQYHIHAFTFVSDNIIYSLCFLAYCFIV